MTGNLYKNILRSIRKWCRDFDTTLKWYIDDYQDNVSIVPHGVIFSNISDSESEYIKNTSRIFQISYVAKTAFDLENLVGNFIQKYYNGDSEKKGNKQKITIFDFVGDEPNSELGTIQITKIRINKIIPKGIYLSQTISINAEIFDY